jgi:hypothetical protein
MQARLARLDSLAPHDGFKLIQGQFVGWTMLARTMLAAHLSPSGTHAERLAPD